MLMLCVVQRVTEAQVTVAGEVVGKIGRGMVVLAAVERGDSVAEVQWTAAKLVAMRIFQNGEKHFECDVRHIGGSILLVSNFTVAAATRKGRRPSFDPAADPIDAADLFDQLVRAVEAQDVRVQTGKFGADMKVTLTNDGPATFILQSVAKESS